MDVFEFRKNVISEYERFSRSFAKIKADDIKAHVDSVYDEQHYWPAPLIQISPNFASGGGIESLVQEGLLDEECRKIFQLGKVGKEPDSEGVPLRLHKHQDEATRLAKSGQSYVLTTGTGSGKSLSYFIPIVDHVLRAKKSGSWNERSTAIVVYPMNALCNSQMEELEKFLEHGYPDGKGPVTFARYTGQESDEDRRKIAARPPDILLTNFVMLELLVTRQDDVDKAVVRNSKGLSFLVLDELHTYRGRQGADVALLVRRVRQALNPELICVGTSATMVSDGDADARRRTVAEIASKLFGIAIPPDNVVTETLQRGVPDSTPADSDALRGAIESGVPSKIGIDDLRAHPVAAWVELNLGLEKDDGEWVRTRHPRTIDDAAEALAGEAGLSVDVCTRYLREFLLLAHDTTDAHGRPFFAFRLHQFISGAGDLFATLESGGVRYLTVNGQQYQPGERAKRLFNMVFCRECGQEYHPVWATVPNEDVRRIEPRELRDRAATNDEMQFGFFMPDSEGIWKPETEGAYPEEWLQFGGDGPRLKSNYRPRRLRSLRVDTEGNQSDQGLLGWFIPQSFRFCLNPECRVYHDASVRSDLTKLSSLSGEGRSSATTVLTLSCLRYLLEADTNLPPEAKKLLGFTDNRQDASLQAGHFNDFIQILLLRGALLAAIQDQPDGALTDDILTQKVYEHLWRDDAEGIGDFAANPELKGSAAEKSINALRDVLGYRLYFDLQRGWRVTNPNLEQLGLLQIDYHSLDECCANAGTWKTLHPLLKHASIETRREVALELLELMRRQLCIKTRYLDGYQQERIRNLSHTNLREPWGLSEDERMFEAALMVPTTPPQKAQEKMRAVYVSHRSRFGRLIRRDSTWGGADNPHMPKKFTEKIYTEVVEGLIGALSTYGLIESVDAGGKTKGYKINAAALKWTMNTGGEPSRMAASITRRSDNKFFRDLYLNVAGSLKVGGQLLHQIEAREHTAQVDTEVREQREEEFRKAEKLRVLFCSPTMELGVDIAELNTVYLRNVPPTPANYAQRSGRAGRSGQPALVVTYCAAKSPHDQYFFAEPARAVAGSVNPPTLDLANEELVRSHLYAVWLSETGQKLASSPSDLLDLASPDDIPIRAELKATMSAKAVRERTVQRGRLILDMLADDLEPEFARWYSPDWLERTVNGAYLKFEKAFTRWRSLYRATTEQMNQAHAVQTNAASTKSERRDAKQRYDEARIQRELLRSPGSNSTADFYTYRYLASQGFLPGYNFPRLPLLAFIPARHEGSGRDKFLQRPRFLGLSEFGPQSIIYHEGSQYKVRKAIFGVRDEESVTVDAKLPTWSARTCPSCGYGHFGDQRDAERCMACNARLEGGVLLTSLYRIEHVSARRTMRITSDEEERQRQGYETQTTFQYALHDSEPHMVQVAFSENGNELLGIQYSSAATIWRVNLGWRRRKEKSIHGFNIDVRTGYWGSDEQAPDDVNDEVGADGKTIQRIVPYVEDRRNVLIIRPSVALSPGAMVTLQYALKRGIESVFQLEENELIVEPLPRQDDRRAILFYEAAEGGAGVLTRLANDLEALPRVAVKALEVCHFGRGSTVWTVDDIRDLEDECEAGCYKCLLSYYNQPEHDDIDRWDKEALGLLCSLTRAEGHRATGGREANGHVRELERLSGSSLEKAWLNAVREQGYSLPDAAQVLIDSYGTRPDFVYHSSQALIYVDGPHHQQNAQMEMDSKLTRELEDGGFTVIRFPANQTDWPQIFGAYPDVFGQGRGE